MTEKFTKLNSKQRQFAINLALGNMTQEQAYIAAGYKPDQARSNAASLINSNKSVKAYYTHLLQRKEDKALEIVLAPIAGKMEIQSKLSEMFRGDFSDFMDDDGAVVVSKKSKHLSAVREIHESVRTDEDGGVTRTKRIKLADPVPVAAELSKLAGHYAPEKHAVVGKLVIEHEFVPWQRGDDNMGGGNTPNTTPNAPQSLTDVTEGVDNG